jgi:glutathione reductase (NADPH)
MPRYDYDLFAIGAGSGGVRASRLSASFGARVAVAEESALGGTCVNLGCIPKKLMVYASHVREELEDAAAGYGWTLGEARFDWRAFIAKKDAEIRRLNGVYERLLHAAGVEVLRGRAAVIDPHTVELDGRRLSAEHILVATGGRPQVPDVPGAEHGITSNEVFHLDAQPERLLIVGGGYIAVEFAGIFHGLGTRVTQIYRGGIFLRGFDDTVRGHLADEMRKKGIDLRFALDVEEVCRRERDLCVTLSDGSMLECDQVLFATGRVPNTRRLGLEQAGVELDARGAVVVDEFSRSRVPSVWAIGDATDRLNLTPVAIHEGVCLASTLFDGRPTKPDHENVPSAVFSQPSIATVGLTEARARERFSRVDVYLSSFRPLKHTLTGRDEKTLVKLLVDGATDRVLGVHVVGADAGEIVQGFAVALECGATKAQFDATLGIHPTAAEELVTLREPVGEGERR